MQQLIDVITINFKYMETTVSNVVYLTTQEFKDKVFNYDVNKEWKYSGELPAIIDFYANWCELVQNGCSNSSGNC